MLERQSTQLVIESYIIKTGLLIILSVPYLGGAAITYFKIKEPTGKQNVNLTLTNYISLNSTGGRLVGTKVQRAVIVVHGLDRDPGTYMANMLNALTQVPNSDINRDSVAICAPYFPNGNDKNIGYPWTAGLAAGRGSTSSALVWAGSQWASGGNNQYPYKTTTVSSYEVLDQLIAYFDDKSIFPNMKQIVVAGHSLGSQMVQRYTAVGNILATKSPVSYYVANPNSYVWMSADRPLSTASCPTYDTWRDGLSSYADSIIYGANLVASGRDAVLARYNSRQIAYARGTLDLGDDSSSCAPFTTGLNRNERFFNFIKNFPPTCTVGGVCDTIDYVASGHDAGMMFASPAGQARLFTDNFYGNRNMSTDFGCPRLQKGDDPYPNPSLAAQCAVNSTTVGTFAGNMTYAGCWEDLNSNDLPLQAYSNDANTIDTCASYCNDAGYSIAGLEWGVQCFCGNALAASSSMTADAGCTMACPGNSSQICGDNYRLSVYSRGTPTKLKPAIAPAVVGQYAYLGCYVDMNPGRSLAALSTSSGTLTLESCAGFCSGYTYFGTEYSGECYCGNTLASGATNSTESDCSYTCSGDSSELCGGSNRLTVYMRNSTSSAVTTTTRSSGQAASTSSVAELSCPGSDGQSYQASSGTNFQVQCYNDHAGGDMGMEYTSSLIGCIQACDSASGCVSYSWVSSMNGQNNPCYLKSIIGADTQSSGVWGGKAIVLGPKSSTTTTSAASSTTTSAASSTSITISVSNSTISSRTTQISGTSTSSISTSTNIACPEFDGLQYQAVSGKIFVVDCYNDNTGQDLTMQYTTSLAGCINYCDSTPGCVAYSWVSTQNGPTNPCYMKSSVGSDVSNAGIWGGRIVPKASTSTTRSSELPGSASSTSTNTLSVQASTSSKAVSSATPISCPGSDGVTFSASSGRSFLVECYNDHTGADLSMGYVTTLTQCVNLCDTTTGCVAYSWVSAANGVTNPCYLHSTVGGNRDNAGVWGGKLIAGSPAATVTTGVSSLTIGVSTLSSQTSTSVSSVATSAVMACPGSNGRTYQSSNGKNFVVECYADRTGTDLSMGYATSLTGCINLCSTTSSCVSYSWVSTANGVSNPCYMKSSYGDIRQNSGVWGGSLAVASSSSVVSGNSTSPTSSTGSGTTSASRASSTPTASLLPDGFKMIGCYQDGVGTNRQLPYIAGASGTNTPSECSQKCESAGYRYSGTEYSSECYCGNELPTTTSSSCNMACAGNSNQICGGSGALTVANNVNWKPPVSVLASYMNITILGCYQDDSTGVRTLGTMVTSITKPMTQQLCLDACSGLGLPYCGLEYSTQCYGGSTKPANSSLAISPKNSTDLYLAGCNMPCSGNSTQNCGGSNRILIWGKA
ncbi:WSC domain-containing protein-like protein 5 [Phlyctema vagabunda]|uniref:WSC domain-containing protein-like protein 5 n=1 Tax=Phlyctema vagabunda TaxID=108571 RepID=A0ABR4PSY4_9HELO